MELTIGEVATRFEEAAAAAHTGERVIVTKDGQPVVELVPIKPQARGGLDFDRLAEVRRELGLDGLDVVFDPEFDDPAFSRRVLGLSD